MAAFMVLFEKLRVRKHRWTFLALKCFLLEEQEIRLELQTIGTRWMISGIGRQSLPSAFVDGLEDLRLCQTPYYTDCKQSFSPECKG